MKRTLSIIAILFAIISFSAGAKPIIPANEMLAGSWTAEMEEGGDKCTITFTFEPEGKSGGDVKMTLKGIYDLMGETTLQATVKGTYTLNRNILSVFMDDSTWTLDDFYVDGMDAVSASYIRGMLEGSLAELFSSIFETVEEMVIEDLTPNQLLLNDGVDILTFLPTTDPQKITSSGSTFEI